MAVSSRTPEGEDNQCPVCGQLLVPVNVVVVPAVAVARRRRKKVPDTFSLFHARILEETGLLCSDGLTDMLSDERIAGILVSELDPRKACDALMDQALEQGGRDNVPAIVAAF